MVDTLRYLEDLARLRRIAGGNEAWLDTTVLEDDFIRFSAHCGKPVLTVKEPLLYSLEGAERDHYKEALTTLGIPGSVPDAVDIAGGCEQTIDSDALIFLSPDQIHADQSTKARSALNPLIERVYVDGAALLRDFAVHQALCGKVACKRGGLDVREIELFPQRFTVGGYELSVTLDTPKKTVQEFKEFATLMKGLAHKPAATVLDPALVDTLTTKALALRKILGSLSRYAMPGSLDFCASTDSYMLQEGDATSVYLHSRTRNENAVVRFARPVGKLPLPGLRDLSGDDPTALTSLVEMGEFVPSIPVLSRRLEDFKAIYDAASRGSGEALYSTHGDYLRMIDGLSRAKSDLESIANPQTAAHYVAQQPPELVEFMVCPARDDLVLHDLLPRLSWNKTLRRYHDTRSFIKDFGTADDAGKKTLLAALRPAVLFNNQQNNDVNLWLYHTHRAMCGEAGITFQPQ